MASKSWQNNFNQQQRDRLIGAFQAIKTGNAQTIQQALKNLGGSAATAPMTDLMRQIAQDYINLGGISQDTKKAINSFTVPKAGKGGGKVGGTQIGGAELGSALNATTTVFKQLGSQLPVVTKVGPDVQVKMMAMPKGANAQQYVQQFLTNKALQFLDPSTKLETQQYLSRANPDVFRAYGMIENTAPVQPSEDTVDPAQLRERLLQAADALDYGKVSKELSALGVNNPSHSSSVGWLQDYLKTAANAVGGTRSQQQTAAARLQTLEQEAKGKPEDTGQLLTLAENITNPIAKDAPLSGLVGFKRSLQAPGQYRRAGFAFKNTAYT